MHVDPVAASSDATPPTNNAQVSFPSGLSDEDQEESMKSL